MPGAHAASRTSAFRIAAVAVAPTPPTAVPVVRRYTLPLGPATIGVLKGAAEMVLRTGKHPAALKDEVTTPGGCTIDGIAKLEQHGISIALIDAVETSTLKAGRLFVPVPIERV